jgi:hypothetical protein
MESCNSLWFVPWGHEFDFFRHRAYSHWTGSDTGIYRPITGRCFCFVDYLWVLLAAELF